MLISYYFPSFLGLAVLLLWQDYFSQNWSGIKAGKGVLLTTVSVAYFVLYVLYLLFVGTFFTVIFMLASIFYSFVVLNKCIDGRVTRLRSIQIGDKVTNNPSA